ncbi:MAG: SDR family NAD(P)-dependent oxidoreductase, partial [Desulfobacterales bacterium]
MKFANKQALIVGGGSGMGLETGKLLVEEGASVTLVGRRQEKLDAARETFDNPNNVSTFRCNLTNKGDV